MAPPRTPSVIAAGSGVGIRLKLGISMYGGVFTLPPIFKTVKAPDLPKAPFAPRFQAIEACVHVG